MKPTKKLPSAVAAIIVVVLIGLAALAVATFRDKNKASPGSEAGTTTTDTTTRNQETGQAAGAFKDGAYTATGSYSTPGGKETITLSVTIQNDEIADTSLVQNAISGQAKDYQQRFASGYKERVVGKKISEVSLLRVAGSSLTSTGFNNALDQIKDDAAV